MRKSDHMNDRNVFPEVNDLKMNSKQESRRKMFNDELRRIYDPL